MTLSPDRESLLQSALDGGGEMSDRELAAFARALIDDDAFAEDYLASRAMLRDLAELHDSVAVPDIAVRVMARLPDAASSITRAAVPSLKGWIAAAAAGLAAAAGAGFYFADSLAQPVDSFMEMPSSLFSAWQPTGFPFALAESQLWTAAALLLFLTVFTHGVALAGRSQSLESGKDS